MRSLRTASFSQRKGVPSNDSKFWTAKAGGGDLLAGRVHVWRLAVDPLVSWANERYEVLTAREREKIQRKHRREDADREAVARVGLRVLLGGYLSQEPREISFAAEMKGKPVLGESHRGVPRVEFNVSHSGAWVMMAFSPGMPLGIDVEQHREIERDELVSGFFSAPEQASWATISMDHQRQVFFEAWTRKESYLKGLGVGLMKALDSFAVELAPGEEPAILWDREHPQAGTDWRLVAVSPDAGYAATLAVASLQKPRMETFTFSPF
ncbi:MAG: 4'-phosphopantetheinyl transferase superfamily protein [Opitutaceae bacterium]|jgi:4'-phosphopantetheinyl transferase|nr:4'-phosphopantetheinyl transferase superfamily protein [Opitutaceae bacterium]